MHVGTVVGSGTKASDVELAKLLLFRQINIVAEVAVVSLVSKRDIMIFRINSMPPNKVCCKKQIKYSGCRTQVHLPSM